MTMIRIAVTVFFIRMGMYNYITVNYVGVMKKTYAHKECKKQ